MNNPIKLLISGADMGSLIASCALRHDFHESPRQEDRFHMLTGQVYLAVRYVLADACALDR